MGDKLNEVENGITDLHKAINQLAAETIVFKYILECMYGKIGEDNASN